MGIVTSWNGITSKCVKMIIKMCKKEFQERSSDEEDVANLENLSKEVLNHLESFKFYSDDVGLMFKKYY